jgi:protein gp37
MACRLRGRAGYPKDDPFMPTFHPERLHDPEHLKTSSKIFVCSMGELFDPQVKDEWISETIYAMIYNPKHIFQVLTKQPVLAWAWHLPHNCWLGVSIDAVTNGCVQIHQLENHPSDVLKFVSFEPLLDEIWPDLSKIDWVIIGAQTGPNAVKPEWAWVNDLLTECDKLGIPVFLKNNLHWPEKRQEFPKVTEN